MKKSTPMKLQFQIDSENELKMLAETFSAMLQGDEVLYLQGELGAGKTTFTKRIAECFSVDSSVVISPTFVLLKQYQGSLPIYHFDLYRLEEEQQLYDIDFYETLDLPGLKIVEWPDKFPSLSKYAHYIFYIQILNTTQRSICVERVT
jgi:tRNA threonylcarbamoyladenosine biosynthesis protein TsaE